MEKITINRTDAAHDDISNLKINLKNNQADRNLNNFKVNMPIENDNNNVKNDDNTINIRRSDKLTHDVKELSSKR
jgi:hypothetical protein